MDFLIWNFNSSDSKKRLLDLKTDMNNDINDEIEPADNKKVDFDKSTNVVNKDLYFINNEKLCFSNVSIKTPPYFNIFIMIIHESRIKAD